MSKRNLVRHSSCGNVSPGFRDRAGFTLLEVMMAVAFMAIALVSVYKLHSQTISMATAVRFYTSAPLLAQSAMSELEMKSSNDLASESGDFGEKFPGYIWTATVDDIESELLGEIAERLKKVDLTVNFDEGGFVYKLRTYRLVTEK